ncbi:lipoprotein [Micromonospora sp. HUAS LYJ1]|uniref:lipoprotein n=1 Tax=Micromonospora sp. HUAS LYJ1 TaxID=3061626 RepID=UPI00267187DC|nr:lipoprotein [Micromonospora sp. HUAS LYJ1]WKU07758.1 lipoprotein [Micromonospora sp. HUAS LYJ1]
MIRRTTALAALTLALTAGCAGAATERATTPAPSASPTTAPVTAGPPWYDDVAPAAAATTVGPKDSACTLSMTFSVPAQWKVEAVTSGAEFTIGPAVPVCEIDAKPAGHIGFLRVWRITGATPLNPQETVDKYLAVFTSPKEQQYRRTKAGPLDAFEATWTEDGERQRAILVSTLYGKLMITLGGLDTEEFEAMLPAYQLVKASADLPA